MDFREFRLLNKAHSLKEVDGLYKIHQLAFQNLRVQGTKESGRKRVLIYDRFDKFFDYDSAVKQALGLPVEQKHSGNFTGLNERYRQYLKKSGG